MGEAEDCLEEFKRRAQNYNTTHPTYFTQISQKLRELEIPREKILKLLDTELRIGGCGSLPGVHGKSIDSRL